MMGGASRNSAHAGTDADLLCRADRLDKYGARVRSHARRVVCRSNSGVSGPLEPFVYVAHLAPGHSSADN